MKRINAKTAQRLVGIAVDVTAAYREADAILDQLAPLIAQINELRQEAAELMEDEANSAESYYDERSERWQEGERGEVFAEWRDTLRQLADALAEEVELPDIDLEPPDWLSDITEQEFEELPE